MHIQAHLALHILAWDPARSKHTLPLFERDPINMLQKCTIKGVRRQGAVLQHRSSLRKSLWPYIYIYIYKCLYVYIYIYIKLYDYASAACVALMFEWDPTRMSHFGSYTYIYIYMCMYIYIYNVITVIYIYIYIYKSQPENTSLERPRRGERDLAVRGFRV